MKKITIKPIIALLLFVSVFAACKKDKDEVLPAPTVNGLEIGSGNSKIGFAGTDIHIEGEILAPANIASVSLDIQPKTGTGWKFNKTYTEGLVGQKNAEFHQHIDIPAETVLGIYRVQLTITDQAGQVTKVDAEIEIKKDLTLPTVSGFEAVPNTAGNDLHVEAAISAVNKIAKVTVEIHGGTYEKEVVYTDVAMVGKVDYNLHKHIAIADAPIGHYHIHLKVEDQAGKSIEVEEHFDKK